MTLRDAIGITLAAAGLLVLSLGRPVFGTRALLYGFVFLAIGILLIYLARRRQAVEDPLDDLFFSDDGDYRSRSHKPDVPDDD